MLPLRDPGKSQVQGSVVLAGNDVQISPDSPLLARARGVRSASRRGLRAHRRRRRARSAATCGWKAARVPAAADEPARGAAARQPAPSPPKACARRTELGFVSRLARDFTGSTGYALGFAFRRGKPEVQVTSNLQGLGINLPAPLNKAAEAALPLRYETALTREIAGAGARLQETLAVELGRIGSACITCATSTAPSRRWCAAPSRVGLAPGETSPCPRTA